MKLRVIIAGGRDFENYRLLEEKVQEVLEVHGYFDNVDVEAEIISGAAKGADSLGERYAREHRIPVKRFPADWKRHGRYAGPLRNEQMADYASEEGYKGILVAFWDGGSRGTRNMISQAKQRNLLVRVVSYDRTDQT